MPPAELCRTGPVWPAVYTLIETCKMNDVDPQAWLADVLARLPDHPANKVVDLLPWNWKASQQSKAAVAA
jgi:transposase